MPDFKEEPFAEVHQGEPLTLMQGSRTSLVARAARTGGRVLEPFDAPPAGLLMAYCAGCMLAIEDDIPALAHSLRQTAGSTPFLVVFTYGEQGPTTAGPNRHGNLMVGAFGIGSTR